MYMKKNFLLTIIVGIALLIAGCSQSQGSASSGTEKVYELDFNTQTPATHAYNKEAIEPWAKLVEEKTNGQVKINVYASGALGGNPTAYKDLQAGVYDIGYITSGQVKDTDLYPLSIADLPFAFDDNNTLTNVMSKFKDKFLEDSFSNDVVYGTFAATDAYQIVSNKPVKTVDDLKGMRLRITGEDSIELGKIWGVTPLTTELTEMYQAFDTGTLDGTAYTGVGSVGMKLFEVAPYYTQLNMSNYQLVYVINAKSFNQLPEDVQKLFEEELFPELSELINLAYDNSEEEALKTYEAEGGTIITPSEEEMKEFMEPVEEVWNNWIKKANDKGFPGDEMMDFFKKVIVEEGGSLPF
jgi:TRAP-type C4-dicarboxylate transport system substrate-binding protein